jgi:SlyX protein
MNQDEWVVYLQERVDELETRLAFQEDTLQALSEQLAHQQSVTEQQQYMMQTLYRQLKDMQDASATDGGGAAVTERPPHY